MSSNKEQMQVEFHNSANNMFFSTYHSFETAIASVSRRNEEYKFQQLKKRYAEVMEYELQIIARNILTKFHNEKQVREMDQMFHQFIKEYMHRFIQKINDL